MTDARQARLADALRESAARWGDRPFLEDARSTRVVPFAALAAAADAWRDALADVDAPVVLLTVREPLPLAVALLGVVAAGRRAAAVDPSTPVEGLRRIAGRLRGADAQVLPVGSDAAVAATRIDVGVDGLPAAPRPTGVPAATRGSWPAPATGSSILFTSGSSGEPKGVELPEAQLLTVAGEVVRNQGLGPDDRGFNPLPLFHVNAQVVALTASLLAGATLVLDARFHRTGFWELLADRRISWLNAVPAVLAVLARTGPIEVPPTLRFVRSASAPLPDRVREAFGATPFVVSWGMTEAASQITATPPSTEHAPGLVGPPLGGQVEARDGDGRQVPPGERGELWIRGPGVIDAYLFGRAADRFDADGWLRTGDAGAVRADGAVVVAGRTDDVVNRGGELIDPAEAEEVLLGDERVQEAVVVGRPHDVLGEEPVALVLPAPGVVRDGLADALAERAAAHLPAARRPVEIHLVEDLPRTAAGKVVRRRALEAVRDEAG